MTVLYTAVLGNYENLVELVPEVMRSFDDCICFTDSPELRATTWRVVRIVQPLQTDPIRSARLIKIRGTKETNRHSSSLWMDNRVRLHAPPTPLMRGDHDLAMPLHSHRRTVDDEFKAVLNGGFDDPRRVRPQYQAFSSDPRLHTVLKERPWWTALLYRRNTPEVAEFNRLWSDFVLAYSRRDQLSVNAAVALSALSVHSWDVDNFQSEYFEWLDRSVIQRNIKAGKFRVRGRYLWDSAQDIRQQGMRDAKRVRDRLLGNG